MSKLSLVNLPAGKVTERFTLRLVNGFKVAREFKWNSKQVLFFFAVMLR